MSQWGPSEPRMCSWLAFESFRLWNRKWVESSIYQKEPWENASSDTGRDEITSICIVSAQMEESEINSEGSHCIVCWQCFGCRQHFRNRLEYSRANLGYKMLQFRGISSISKKTTNCFSCFNVIIFIESIRYTSSRKVLSLARPFP